MRGIHDDHAHPTRYSRLDCSWPSRRAPPSRRPRALPRPVTLLNVSYDPTRELYEDFNAAVRHLLEGQDRPGRDDPPVARRLGQAGPLGDRRPRGRRGHAGAGLRHRPDRREGRLAAGQLADPAAQQQLALHLDHRVPGAEGKSQGDQGLGRPGQARRLGHHAQPQDLGRRPLELPGGLGLGPAPARRQRRDGQGVRQPSSTGTCRCSTPAPAAPPPRSWSGASATCCSPGRTRPCSRSRSWARASSRSWRPSVSILAEPPVAVVDKVAGKHGTKAVAQAYLEYLYTAGGPGDRGEALLPPAARGGGREVRGPVPQGRRCSPWTRSSAAGRRRSRLTSPTGRCSTRSISRGASPGCHVYPYEGMTMRHKSRSVLPGFGLTPGDHLHLSQPDGAAPAGDRLHPDRGALRAPRSGPPSPIPRVRGVLPGDLRRLVRRGAGQHRLRPPGRLGAGALPVSRAGGWWTPWWTCRSRCRRRWRASRSPRSTSRTAGSGATSSRSGSRCRTPGSASRWR